MVGSNTTGACKSPVLRDENKMRIGLRAGLRCYCVARLFGRCVNLGCCLGF